MGAGLIYAGIVVVWAVVLAPMWIRHSDERFDPLMAARTSAGIRVLNRRRTPRPAAVAARPTAPPATARAARYAAAPTRAARSSVPRTMPRSQTRPQSVARRGRPAFARRRRFLLSLAAATVGLGGCAVVGVAPAWVPALPLIVLVGYLWYVRGAARRAYEQKRRERLIARHRAEARRRAELQVAAQPPLTVDAPRPAAVNPDGTWRPVRIPLPTYVTAPIAPRHDGRPIVLGAYGSWTRRRMADLMRRSRTASGREVIVGSLGESEHDEAASRWPRAVNE